MDPVRLIYAVLIVLGLAVMVAIALLVLFTDEAEEGRR